MQGKAGWLPAGAGMAIGAGAGTSPGTGTMPPGHWH